MGTLAAAFAAAFLGPQGNGLTGDGQPRPPNMADAAALGAAIDSAIPNAQDLSAEQRARETADTTLQQNIDAVNGRADAIGDNLTGFASDVYKLFAVDEAGIREAKSGIDALKVQVENAVAEAVASAAEADAAAASSRDAIAGFGAVLMLGARPGDNPDLFTVDMVAGVSGIPSTASVAIGAAGRALRILGRVPFLAPRALRAIEPGHVYKVRAAFRRIVDTTDTAGDAVHFAVAWYGADTNLLGVAPLLVSDDTLRVADGRVERSALISTAPLDPSVLPIPAGAAYCRPFVAAFGDVPVTDFEVIESVDVSDAGIVVPDLDATSAAIATLQGQVRALAAAAGITLS